MGTFEADIFNYKKYLLDQLHSKTNDTQNLWLSFKNKNKIQTASGSLLRIYYVSRAFFLSSGCRYELWIILSYSYKQNYQHKLTDSVYCQQEQCQEVQHTVVLVEFR